MITLIRHCQSEFNVLEEKNHHKNADLSFVNCGLTTLGKYQASKLQSQFDLIIVSPMKRTLDTLKYSNINYKHILVLPLVREFKVDICDFMINEKQIIETEEEILSRCKETKTLLKILSTQYKSIGVISHRDFIWFLTNYEKNGEEFGKYLNNGETIEFKNEF